MPGRLSGFLDQELKIGHFYLTYFLICSVTIFHLLKNRNLFYLSILIFFIVSLMIGERANFLRLFGITLLFLLITEKTSLYKKLLILSFGILSFSTIVMTNENLKTRFYGQFLQPLVFEFDLNYIKNGNMYFANYDRAYEIFKKNKSFGVGIKNFRIESKKEMYRNDNLKYTDQSSTTHPHQIHLEFLSETGLFGYLCFLIFIFITLFLSIKSYLKNKNLYLISSILFFIISIIPLLPSGSFFTTYAATLFWINFAVMIANQITK
tara:strand:+ start:117 stop:911 length:795 start_codon:yes stop_codon:yes gene_type:complete